MKQTLDLSLVIPVFNEQSHVEELINRCVAVCDQTNKRYEIVLVDDGSKDHSVELMKTKAAESFSKIVIVMLNRNYGQHAAVLAGLAQAKGQTIVTLDADLQNPPEEIPKLLELIDQGCDVVGSVRQRRKDSLFRRMSSKLVNRAVQKTTGIQMSDYGCMLRAYDRRIVDAVLCCTERSTFIPILANSFARNTGEVEVAHAARQDDASKYGFWKLVNLQFDLLTTMTTFPLRVLSLVGACLSFLGFMAGLSLFGMRLIYGPSWAADGVFTIFAGLFVVAGVQLLGMGVMGEYLGRVYNDVRQRPRFFVHEITRFGYDSSVKENNTVINLNH